MQHWTDARLRANPPKGIGRKQQICDQHPDAPQGGAIVVSATGANIRYQLRCRERYWSWPWPEYSLTQARSEALEMRGMILRGEVPTKAAVRARKGTFTMTLLWESYTKSEAFRGLSELSRKSYRSAWRSHLEPVLGALAVTEVGDGHIERVLARRPKSKRLLWAVMSVLFKHARMDLKIDADPMRLVRPPKPAPPRRRIASTDELRAVYRALTRWTDRDTCDMVLLLIYQGMRRAEPCHLKWSDIDFEAGTLRIRTHKSASKTGYKTIPLNDEASALLANRTRGNPNDYVFSIRSPEVLSRRWEVVREKAGVPDLNLHDLRRTFATRAVANGVGIKELSSLLGHSSTAVTERVYAVPISLAHSRASQTVGSHLGSVMRSDGYGRDGP